MSENGKTPENELTIEVHADGAQSSQVPIPLPDDPYVAVRQAHLVETELEPEEVPTKAEELQSLGSRVHLMGEEFEAFEPIVFNGNVFTPPLRFPQGIRTDSSYSSASLDFTTPLSPDHPLTYILPTPAPTRVSFYRRTACMAVRTQPTLSPGMSARIANAAALSPSYFHKRYRSSYETSSSSSPTLPVQKRYRGTSELILDTDSKGMRDGDHGLSNESQGLEGEGLGLEEEEAVLEGQQQAVLVVDTTVSEPLGLGYGVARCHALESIKEIAPSTYKVGQSSKSVPEREGVKRISAFRQPTLVTWVDPKDDRVYTDVPAYAPPTAPVQIPPSPEWSLGSLPVSPSSPEVPSPIASLIATPTTTISVDEDQFIEVGRNIDRDVRELYTRSGVVRDEIFSQRYRFRSLECEQERTTLTFGALWRPVLALKALAGHVIPGWQIYHGIEFLETSQSGSYPKARPVLSNQKTRED
ncbi:hypothetical protein Tco_0612373 [Tanacetum coccineum]